MSFPAPGAKFGGSVTKVTNGVHPFLLASMAAVVQFVPAKRSSLAKTIWQVGFQPLQKSGTQRNGALTPEQVAPASNKKVWWRCPKGHDYQAVVASRTQRNGGCPYCANTKVLPGFNDLATKYPEIAAQWHPTMNGSLTPDHVLPGSRKKVWWQCSSGHVWQAVIYSRTGNRSSGCPFCTGYALGKRWNRYQRYQQEMCAHSDDKWNKEE